MSLWVAAAMASLDLSRMRVPENNGLGPTNPGQAVQARPANVFKPKQPSRYRQSAASPVQPSSATPPAQLFQLAG